MGEIRNNIIAKDVRFLSSYDKVRENNFTLIRLVLAWLVLYGHSFPLQKTEGYKEPLVTLFQGSTWIGALAVNCFFVISGYLILGSFMKRGIKNYTISRVLRILPALIVCILISVFVLGPAVTTSSISDYFSDSRTYKYLLNGLAIFRIQHFLPGVFRDLNLTSVNGSLWTLAIEARCYIIVALIGLTNIFKYKHLSIALIFGLFFFGFYNFTDLPLIGVMEKWQRPTTFFLVGCLFYMIRDKIPMERNLFFLFGIILMFSFGKDYYTLLAPVCYAYAIFYLAYCTRHINIDLYIGDVSYGFYIYAWPIQQLIAAYLPNLNPYHNTIISTVLVFTLSFLSWKFIEKPALALKRYFN